MAEGDALIDDGCDVCEPGGTCILCDERATVGVCEEHAGQIRRGRVLAWPYAAKLVAAAKALGYAPKQGARSILPRKEVLTALGLDHDKKGTTLERATRIVRFVDEHPEELCAIRNRTLRGADSYVRAFRQRPPIDDDEPTSAEAADTIRVATVDDFLGDVRDADGILTDPPYNSVVTYGRLAAAAAGGAVKEGAPVCVVLPEDILADVLDVMRANGLTYTGRAFGLDCKGRDGRRTVGGGLSYWKLAAVFVRGSKLKHPIVTKVIRSAGADKQWHEHGLDVPLVMELLDALRIDPGGLVVDPFTGGGTVAVACRRSGYRFLGGDAEAERVRVAQHRLSHPDQETFPPTWGNPGAQRLGIQAQALAAEFDQLAEEQPGMTAGRLSLQALDNRELQAGCRALHRVVSRAAPGLCVPIADALRAENAKRDQRRKGGRPPLALVPTPTEAPLSSQPHEDGPAS